ncbi:MAG TPA: formyltransferase family protein, partial [Steroidobacter sp.]|nr:formyltransferase family protein [Steroidobacter sp.]
MRQSTASAQSPLPIAILISGRGSNMSVIAERAAAHDIPVDVRVVVSDQPQAAGLAIAASMNIPTLSISPREHLDRASYEAALARALDAYAPRLIVLAGFMRILSPTFV